MTEATTPSLRPAVVLVRPQQQGNVGAVAPAGDSAQLARVVYAGAQENTAKL